MLQTKVQSLASKFTILAVCKLYLYVSKQTQYMAIIKI